MTSRGEITRLLEVWSAGDDQAGSRVFSMLYTDLRRLAAAYVRGEGAGHTLQATALVHEAYVRLFQGKRFDWKDRGHLFCAIAQVMRHVMVDHARRTKSGRRGGSYQRVELDEPLALVEQRPLEMLALDEALDRLEARSPRQRQIVELRFFAGFTEIEAADILGVSPETVRRDWRFARAWLKTETAGPLPDTVPDSAISE